MVNTTYMYRKQKKYPNHKRSSSIPPSKYKKEKKIKRKRVLKVIARLPKEHNFKISGNKILTLMYHFTNYATNNPKTNNPQSIR